MTSNILTLSHTAIDDLKFHLVHEPVWVRSANIHIVTNDANYGNFDAQAAKAATGAVVEFRDFNIQDLFFRNTGAGLNTTVQVVAILMTEGRKQELGV